jgi:hypothetical protein
MFDVFYPFQAVLFDPSSPPCGENDPRWHDITRHCVVVPDILEEHVASLVGIRGSYGTAIALVVRVITIHAKWRSYYNSTSELFESVLKYTLENFMEREPRVTAMDRELHSIPSRRNSQYMPEVHAERVYNTTHFSSKSDLSVQVLGALDAATEYIDFAWDQFTGGSNAAVVECYEDEVED